MTSTSFQQIHLYFYTLTFKVLLNKSFLKFMFIFYNLTFLYTTKTEENDF